MKHKYEPQPPSGTQNPQDQDSGLTWNVQKRKKMQGQSVPKFELLDKLPTSLKIETTSNLSNLDLVNLAMTSKYHVSFFKSILDVRKLLHHVVRGEHEAMQAMLKKDRNLIFRRGKVTDRSGRIFDNISAYEYTLWALDYFMWTMMLECIFKHEKSNKEIENLLSQYNKVDTVGVTYKLDGATITENHFDFAIINELEKHVNLIQLPWMQRGWSDQWKHWIEGVGSAQKLLPMHVVYEYCSDLPFYPLPQFTSKPPPSQRFYNVQTSAKYENWFNNASTLGIEFAIHKGYGNGYFRAPIGEVGGNTSGSAKPDLDAMKALYKLRKENYVTLKADLEKHLIVFYPELALT